MQPVNILTVPALFDAHVHFRQGKNLPTYVNLTARCCDRAIVMPNPEPPITDASMMQPYMRLIQDAVTPGIEFHPYMTLYMTPTTTPQDIMDCVSLLGDAFIGVKIYPQHGTTNSSYGIPPNWFYTKNDIDPAPKSFWETLKAVADCGRNTFVHGEDPKAGRLDKRESSFLWSGFVEEFFARNPKGKLTIEHISTDYGLDIVGRHANWGFKCGGSLTLHHQLLTLDDTYAQVHNTCWPAPLYDKEAIRNAARIPYPCYWLGSDSAPHPIPMKHRPKASCGCFTSPVLAEKLAEIFAEESTMEIMTKKILYETRMTNFTSKNAGEFFGIPPSGRTITLVRQPRMVPEEIEGVRPWLAGEQLEFSLREGAHV